MKLHDIRMLSEQYDKEHKTKQPALSDRFKALVKEYGVSSVSAATGLAESTVVVYMRQKPANISEYNVVKAETILNNL